MQFNVKKNFFFLIKRKNLEFFLPETRKKKKNTSAFVQGE